MSAALFLAELAARGVALRADGDALVARAPAGVLSAALREGIRAEKATLLVLLRRDADGCRRCGGAAENVDAGGGYWCRTCDVRRAATDLAALAGWPRLPLPPLLVRAGGSADAWRAFLAGAAGANVGLAARHLRAHLRARGLGDADVTARVAPPPDGWWSLWRG